jgi:hypothetical protein
MDACTLMDWGFGLIAIGAGLIATGVGIFLIWTTLEDFFL